MIRIDQAVLSALEEEVPDRKTAVHRALQIAIEIEHATIPPYLFALYSLKPGPLGGPGPNEEVAAILRSVIREEMVHLTLACNVLNALGGHPEIDRPDFIPKYPRPLPGTVAAGTIVRLATFSRDLVRDVFMAIEKPRRVIPIDSVGATAVADDVEDAIAGDTLGDFYERIVKKIRLLGDGAFTRNCSLQVDPRVPSPARDLVLVTDVKTATDALEVIISQGEGSRGSPLDVDGQNAHYYRFVELAYMHRLKEDRSGPEVPSPHPRLKFGDPIPFDESAIFCIPPPAGPPRGRSRRVLDDFNYTYTTLLKQVHDVFNGHPERFPMAFGIMMSLRQQAIDMMSGTNLPAPIAPTFEYHPVNTA
jgi:hypothetical protein